MPTEKDIPVDDETIAAVIHHPETEPEGTVVFAHGFGSDKEGRYRRRAAVAAAEGFTAIRFDFRGNNDSSRTFDKADLSTRIKDLEAVIDTVEEGSVYVYGASFGGLVALHTAARGDAIDALAVRAPVTYIKVLDDIVQEVDDRGVYEHIPGKEVRYSFVEDLRSYSSTEIIDDITDPTLIMHGTDDENVPLEPTRDFYDRLRCTKEFVTFDRQGHRFDDYADCRAVMRSLQWFREA